MTKAQIIQSIAGRLGVPAQWLDGLIAFESNYDPLAVAKMPYNAEAIAHGEPARYAKGLIQFIDPTAAWLGFIDSQDLIDKNPTFESQMENAVYPYLQKMSPFISEQDFYMAVFYPAYRRTDPGKPFPDPVIAVNPGITTPRDYINHVNRAVATRRIIPLAAGGAAALVAAFIFLR